MSSYLRLTGISGAAAVAISAWFAHRSNLVAPEFRDIFKTATNYHLIHTLLAGISALNCTGKKRMVVCSLCLTGVALFSLPLYVVATKQDRSYGKLTPFGGVAYIAAWIAFGFM